MADSAIAVTPGSGVNVDTRTQSNGDHRQVICVGDQTGAQIVTVSANGELVVSQLDSAHAASYSASGAATPSGSTTGQLFTIMGSASKLIRVTFVEVSLVATTAAATILQLSKLSTATTGTASAMTAVPHDSNDAAATASVNSYNAPTNGTVVGSPLRQVRAWAQNTTDIHYYTWTFTDRLSKGIALRGTTQGLSVVLNNALTGCSINASFEWTEE